MCSDRLELSGFGLGDHVTLRGDLAEARGAGALSNPIIHGADWHP